jgi:hypothetical protein
MRARGAGYAAAAASSEAEMVALFLRTELPAARFRQAGLV